MIFLYEHVKPGLRITRVFGRDDCVEIPEKIREIPVTELGAYVFSDRMDVQDYREAVSCGKFCREDGTAADGPEGLPEIVGSSLRELLLPESLVKIGRYAFYNCGQLQKVRFGGALADIGAGALTGCHKIQRLEVTVKADGSSCLREILSELPEELRVDLKKNGEEGRFWFPEFFEEGVENTPARILENHVHGSGIRYRNCFAHRSLNVREYDKLFAYARAWEKERAVIALAMDRILYPMELSEGAEERYLNYLKEHLLQAFLLLAEEKEYAALGRLLKKAAPDKDTAASLLSEAEKNGDAQSVSVLMDYLHGHTKKQRKVFEL